MACGGNVRTGNDQLRGAARSGQGCLQNRGPGRSEAALRTTGVARISGVARAFFQKVAAATRAPPAPHFFFCGACAFCGALCACSARSARSARSACSARSAPAKPTRLAGPRKSQPKANQQLVIPGFLGPHISAVRHGGATGRAPRQGKCNDS